MSAAATPSPAALTIAKALEHPLRADVFFEYQRRPASPSEVAAALEQPLNLVAYHTRYLADLECVRVVRTERRRGAVMTTYAAALEPVVEDEDWQLLPARLRRAMTLTALSGVADAARAAALEGGFDLPRAHLSRTPLRLDAVAMDELAADLRSVYERALALQAASAQRSVDAQSVELSLLLYEEVNPRSTE